MIAHDSPPLYTAHSMFYKRQLARAGAENTMFAPVRLQPAETVGRPTILLYVDHVRGELVGIEVPPKHPSKVQNSWLLRRYVQWHAHINHSPIGLRIGRSCAS